MGLVSFFQRKDREKTIKKLRVTVDKVNAKEAIYSVMTDEELVSQTDILKNRYKEGETLDAILPDAFAVMREAMIRAMDYRNFHWVKHPSWRVSGTWKVSSYY